MVRETPLHAGHLRLMTQVTEAGAVVLPPVPGFYTLPTTISEIVDHTITKILDQFHLDLSLIERWSGINPRGPEPVLKVYAPFWCVNLTLRDAAQSVLKNAPFSCVNLHRRLRPRFGQ